MSKKSKKRKKLDILYRKLNKEIDPNSTYEIMLKLNTEDKIRKILGKKKQYPAIPSRFK